VKTRVITEDRLNELLRKEEWLNCLVAAGVDNWVGYESAQEMYNEETEG